MRIFVAGKERTEDLGGDIAAAVGRMPGENECVAPQLPDFACSALSLESARNEADYLDKLMWLLSIKNGVSTVKFYYPRRRGLLGRVHGVLRAFLWRLLQYQHDRIASLQNTINVQFAYALDFVRSTHRQELDAVRDEVRALREQVAQLKGDG